MDKLAVKLNELLLHNSKDIFEMLSEVGTRLYFPKGILSQSQEAKECAKKYQCYNWNCPSTMVNPVPNPKTSINTKIF